MGALKYLCISHGDKVEMSSEVTKHENTQTHRSRLRELVRKTSTLVAAAAIVSLSACNGGTPKSHNHRQYSGSSRNCTSVYEERISDLHLGNAQLKNDLGIKDNSRPLFGIGAKTYVAWSGWQGSGSYNFLFAGCNTPYLSDMYKLNNWNYLLYGKNRIEPRWKLIENGKALSSKGIVRPVNPEIKSAVDNLVRTGRMRIVNYGKIR